MLNDNTDNSESNIKLLTELANAYEHKGEKLHPAFARLVNPLKRVDCLFHETTCKHYCNEKCKLSSKAVRRKNCPREPPVRAYIPSSISSAKHPFSQVRESSGLPPNNPLFPPDDRANPALEHKHILRVGRGFYCKVCRIRFYYKRNYDLHLQSKSHKMRSV
ncbi:C2H2-type zinc finger protein [Candidatus Dojkabacteria bacterium]|jgi:hypothetical protein|nr:C2H2-type zinc finger protein [Candidatus Dojkabacteria bacterium]